MFLFYKFLFLAMTAHLFAMEIDENNSNNNNKNNDEFMVNFLGAHYFYVYKAITTIDSGDSFLMNNSTFDESTTKTEKIKNSDSKNNNRSEDNKSGESKFTSKKRNNTKKPLTNGLNKKLKIDKRPTTRKTTRRIEEGEIPPVFVDNNGVQFFSAFDFTTIGSKGRKEQKEAIRKELRKFIQKTERDESPNLDTIKTISQINILAYNENNEIIKKHLNPNKTTVFIKTMSLSSWPIQKIQEQFNFEFKIDENNKYFLYDASNEHEPNNNKPKI